MILRHWKGLARNEEAENYLAHLRTETLPNLSKIQGFISASILRRPLAEGIEFLVITTWESMEAIRSFAGQTADVAVVPLAVQAMMVDYDRRVSHYEVVSNFTANMAGDKTHVAQARE